MLVLKYGGLDPERRAGGREVWNLRKLSTTKVAGLLDMAIRDYVDNGQPWLIQGLIRKKFPVTYLAPDQQIHTKELYARFMPFFAFAANGQPPQLLSFVAHFRNFWKVHCQKDAIATIVAAEK